MYYEAITRGPKRAKCTLNEIREAKEGHICFEARTGGQNVKCTLKKVQEGQVNFEDYSVQI